MGEPQEKSVEEALDELDQMLSDDLVKERESTRLPSPPGDKLECPICGSMIPLGSLKCPDCSCELPERLTTDEPKTTADEALPQQHANPAPQAETSEPQEGLPSDDSSPPGEEETELGTCPVCGKDSPTDAAKCPHCGTEFEPIEEAEPTEAPAKIVSEADQAALALDALQSIAESEVPRRKRKLRGAKGAATSLPHPPAARVSGKLGVVNGTGFVNGKHPGRSSGVTNGTGMVYGAGQVNGLGMVNGVSLVNGKGASNGLGVKSPPRRTFVRGLLTQWKTLAVLVVLMVVISTFFVAGLLMSSDGCVVDGNFGEWDDLQSYPALVSSTSSGINIEEWSIHFDGNDIYYYFRTESSAMAGATVESFCIYIDTDGSSSTGYALGDMGAEYRVIIEGWDGELRSSSLSRYGSSSDHMNWSGWDSIGSSDAALDGSEVEGHALLFGVESPHPKALITSRDQGENFCSSVPVPVGGALLIVEQSAVPSVADSGVVGLGPNVPFLRVTLSAVGGSGTVRAIAPSVAGCRLASSFTEAEVRPGTGLTHEFSVDTTSSTTAQLATLSISEEDVESDFDDVLVLGDGPKAYVSEPPEAITIDGAFGDWAGRTSPDTDFAPVGNDDIDIQRTGANATSQDALFFVSVRGEILSGALLPHMGAKPVAGGGGSHTPARKTGEDFTRIYVDTDLTSTTGLSLTHMSREIGADRIIEVRGQFGSITSSTMLEFDNGAWTATGSPIAVAKDQSRIELSVNLSDLGAPGSIDFIFETTCWNGRSEMASFDESLVTQGLTLDPLGTRSWPVVSPVSASDATAMSYQRKLFHDGTNFWSFSWDGSNTVYKYSSDGGVTWTSRGQAFTANSVSEVSVWYDSANNIVYAIGDTTTASVNVKVKRGTVAPATATISWGSDYNVPVSTLSLGGKNSFICKADDGYLWLISMDHVSDTPQTKYNLGVWKSNSTDDVSGWTFSDHMLPVAGDSPGTAKGIVVPAGSNGYVWSIFTSAGNVKSKKYDGAWPNNPQDILSATGTLKANTNIAPPSALVDSRGVVHVVYGDCTESGGVAYTKVLYTHNNTDAETYPTGTDLDATKPSNVANTYPTISLDASTGNLYAFWIRTDTAIVGKTIMGSKYSGGSWSSLTLDGESSYTKQYLTSVYSVSAPQYVCWQWTQNITSPIEVIFDIPELGDVLIPTAFMVLTIAVAARTRGRRRDRPSSSRR